MVRRVVLLAVALGLVGTLGAPPASADPTVAFAGDSIGDRARLQIRNTIEPRHRITFYETQDSATIGRLGPELLRAVAEPDGPDIVLVELGVGNAFWGTDAGDFRDQVHELTRRLLRHATCVRWFEQRPGGNLAYPRINDRAVAFNRIVRDVVNDFARARTVHYEAWTRLVGNRAFVPDRLHLNALGKRGLARLAEAAVTGCDPAFTSGRFWDVPDTYWAAEEIDWVAGQRLIDGYPNDTFRAEIGGIVARLDRLSWARALWRSAGRPGGHPPAPWPDGAGQPALAWAAAEGIVPLPPDHRFRPADPISRGDAIGWLYRAAGRPDVSSYPPHGLTDVPPGLSRAVRWAKGAGVLTTPDGGAFAPRRPLSRAEAAVFCHRFAHP